MTTVGADADTTREPTPDASPAQRKSPDRAIGVACPEERESSEPLEVLVRARRQLSRVFQVGGICAAVLVLTVPSASAAVVNSSTADEAILSSDGDGDAISLTCTGGQVRYVQGPLDLLACNATKTITISGEDGGDTIDLSALQAGDFPLLSSVFINPGLNFDADTVKGSFFADEINADPMDEIHSLAGNDVITSGGLIFAGDGNDTVSSAQGSTDLGPGDDRLVDPASGPWNGGPGQDTLAWDFSAAAATVEIHFSITDSVFHLDAPTIPPTDADLPSTQFEFYEVTLLQGGVQTWNSAGYSGSVDIKGLEGVDMIVAGPGEDFLDGGGGTDEVTGGGGFDFVRAGTGDDTVFAQDGVVDRVNCGDGNDTVVCRRHRHPDRLRDGPAARRTSAAPPPPPAPAAGTGRAGDGCGQGAQDGRAGRQGEVQVHLGDRRRDVPVQAGHEGLEGLHVAPQGRHQEPEGQQGRHQARAQGACRARRRRRQDSVEEDLQGRQAGLSISSEDPAHLLVRRILGRLLRRGRTGRCP